jgi:hypothetical protein
MPYLAFAYVLTSFSSLSPRTSAVISRSYCACRPNQNSADVPKNRASLRAVSARCTNSLSGLLLLPAMKYLSSLFKFLIKCPEGKSG